VDKVRVSVVIPCYRSGEGFPGRVAGILEALGNLGPAIDPEIVLVADGWETATSSDFLDAAELSEHISAVSHLRNYGEQSALRTGILHSTGDVIVTMDDDGQHDPTDIAAVVSPVLSGRDILVYGFPHNDPHGSFRGFLSRWGKKVVARLSGFPVESVSSFRAFIGDLRGAFTEVRTRDLIVDSVLLDHVEKPGTILLDYRERQEGKSGYSGRALLRHAINLVFSFPSRPLRVLGIAGVTGFIFGLVVLIFTAIEAVFFGGLPEGYPTLVGLVAVLSGIQLVGISAMAEYLGRLYERGIRSEVILTDPLSRAPRGPNS
jgi:glycosyltransferase involved in cell wall biosynthesis